MHRTLFEIGGFRVPSFGVMVMLGFLAALWLSRRRAPRFGVTADQISDVAFWGLAGGILGARLGFIVQELDYYREHPNELLSLQFDGLTSFGGVILAIVVLILMSRRLRQPPLLIMDVLAPGFLLGNVFGRIGCLLNGCCYGGHCDLPWAIPVQGMPGLYHPAQVYDALMNLAFLAFFFLVLDRRPLRIGQSTGFILIAYGVSRFLYEFWRAGTTSTTIAGLPITEAQVAALLVATAGAILWARGSKSPPAAKADE